MTRQRPSFRSHHLTRIMRMRAARWMFVVVLAPLLTLGAFGGAEFLVHVDDNHGLHLHALEAGPVGEIALAPGTHHHDHECLPDHNHAIAADSDSSHPCSIPGGVPVSVPDHEQLSARATNVLRTTCLFAIVMVADLVSPMAPDADAHLGSPGGRLGSSPRDLFAVTSRDRLIRTSCALLI